MGLYYCLDFIGTLTEALFLYTFNHCFLKQPRFTTPICKWITPTTLFALSWLLTWFSELGAYKTIFLIACIFIVLKLCYKDSIYQILTAMEIWFMSVCLFSEAMGIAVAIWIFGDDTMVLVDGQNIMRWEAYIVILLIRATVFFVSYLIVKNIRYKIQLKDCLVLTFTFLIGFFVYILSNYNYLNLSRIADMTIFVSSVVLSLTFYITFIYAKNTLYLREQEQKDKMQIAQLQQQFAYYQEKLKDEEKVRSVYHDMKNHLLVLQKQINSPETAEMVEKLQSQVAMYEDYEHTGNDILDIILKEKSEKAREKHIALSVTADLSDVDFIEPLDISTIFGNGLDNAIEASEKLPEEQRAILVKAGKMQNFFSVLIENNCLQNSGNTKNRTTKADEFLHGFGISNMQKAAEKYSGQLTTKCESGKFLLKILLPIPSRLEVQ